jgi:hypothetical protein
MQDTLTRTEELQCIFWDMYKDAYNFRPRHIDTSTWTEAQFEEEFKDLQEIIEREAILRNDSEARASHEFEMRMLSLLQTGAKDREMALRWIHEAEGSNGDDEYLCYLLGLAYGYFRMVDRVTV